MLKDLLKQLTRIADALEKSNMQDEDSIKLQCLWHREASAQNASAIHTQEQVLAVYRQQQALQEEELPISKYTGQTYDPRWAGQSLQGVEEGGTNK